MNHSGDSQKFRSLFESLEERVLFDGVPDASFVLPQQESVEPIPAQSQQVQPAQATAPVQLIVIDSGVENVEVLLDEILQSQHADSYEVLALDPTTDGIAQITDLLEQSDRVYSAVHIVSHGEEGKVYLGSNTLDAGNLNQYADQLSQWSNALTEDADLLFYGCNLAGDPAGEDFIDQIGTLTGADVAASDDLTGHESLGGDWDLEYEHGDVNAKIVVSASAQQAFFSVLAPQPTATVNVPSEVLMGEFFEFNVVFDNVGPAGDVGYQPFLDVVIPFNGAEDTGEGITIAGNDQGTPTTSDDDPPITFLGQEDALEYDILTFDVMGEATHPLTGEVITGTPGDMLVVVQPHIGSFAPGQPEVTIDMSGLLSDFANLGSPLEIVARAGFDFGDSPTDSGNIVSETADSSTWSASGQITPTLFEVSKTYLGTEDETATGPNFARQYQIDVNIADGQTLTDLDITDYLPNNARFLQVVSATSTDPSTNFSTSEPVYTLDPVTNQLTYPDPHELVVTADTVTGEPGDTPEISIVFEYYIAEFDSEGDRVIPDDNSSGASSDGEDDITPGVYPDHEDPALLDLDSTSPNDVDALGDWNPLDPDDVGGTDNAYAEPLDGTPDHILDDKSIAIQKTVELINDQNSPGYSPGDVVEYTLNFQISDYYTFGDLAIYDVMGDGLRFDQTFDPTFSISDRSGDINGTFNWSVTSNTGDQQTQGAADLLSIPGGDNLLIDESRIDRTDDAAENAASDGTTHLVFDIEQALQDAGRANGTLQGGVVLTDAELRPGDGDATGDEHDDAASPPAIGTITFRAVVQQEFADEFPSGDRSVDHGDVLHNDVDIYGTVRDNIDNTEVVYREDDDSAASIETVFGEISKTIFAINRDTDLGSTSGINPFGLIVGDEITYSIEYTLPNSNFEDLSINDFLPFPILEVDDPDADGNPGPNWFFDASAPSSDIPAVGVISLGANDTFYNVTDSGGATIGQTHYENNVSVSTDTDQNRLSVDLGDFDTDAEVGSTIHLMFTIRINDEDFSPYLYLTNTTRVTEASTNGPDSAVDDLVLIQMEVPNIQVRKGVVDSTSQNDSFSAATGPTGVTFAPAGSTGTPFSGTITNAGLNANHIDADISGVDPGDTVRFAVTLRNWSQRATLYDTQIRDLLPAGLDYVANSLQVVDGTGEQIDFVDLDGNADGSGFFATGIELIDPGPTNAGDPDHVGQRGAVDGSLSGDGRNIAIVFYDAVVTEAVGTQQDFQNTASLFAGSNVEGGNNLFSTPTSDNAVVSRDRVDLELDKQVSDNNPSLGDVITWTITVSNNAANATTSATGVIVDDTIPTGQQIVVGSHTDTSGGSFDYFTGRWILGNSIAPGASQTLTFESIVGIGAEFTGSHVDLELETEFDNTTPSETDTVTVTVSLTNNAEVATVGATGVTVGDLGLPAGLSFVGLSDVASHGSFNSGTGLWDLTGETIGVGQTVTLTFEATVDNSTAGTSISYAPEVKTVNETDIDSTAGDSSTDQDDDGTAAINVDDGVVPPPVASDGLLWVDENQDGVQDAGEAVLANVNLLLYDLSSGSPVLVTNVATDVNGIYSFTGLTPSTDYEIHIDPLELAAGGALETYRITSQNQHTIAVAETTNNLSSVATIDRTGDGVDETAANETIDVLAANALPADGYKIIITDMTGGVARVTEDNLVEFEYTDFQTSGSFNYMILDDRFDNDAMGYDDDGDGMTDRAIVSFRTGSAGTVSSESLDIGFIEEQIDLELNKYADRKVSVNGEEVIFTLILSNNGQFQEATGVTVTDLLPAELTYVSGSAVATQGSFDGATWTVGGSIGAGETVTLTYRARVNGIEGTVLLNGAEVATVDQIDIDSQAGNDDGDFSEDDEDNAGLLIGTRTAETITNSAQVFAQDQADFDSAPRNEDHDQSEDDEATASFVVSNTGVIGNTVWVDEDSDGVLDAGESGIANVLVELKDAGGVVIATTRTDANGQYLFDDLPAGDYFVDIDESTLPPGMTQTTTIPSPGADQTNQAHSSDGYAITLGPGEENLTGDFGYNYNPTSDVDGNSGLATLGDRIWADTDGDGVQDPGEVGVEDVVVNLYTDPDGDGVYDNLVSTVTTDALGNYIFDELPAGSYVVSVDPTGTTVDGWTQTGDPDEFGKLATNPDNQSTPIVLNAGDVNLDIDFGYQPPVGATGTIGSTIWFDLNNSGDDETNIGNEPPLEGVTVSLIQDLDGNGVWDPATEPIIATDITDVNGMYLFTGLSLDDGDGDADYIVWVNDTNNVLDILLPSYDADGTGTPNVSATSLDTGSPDDLDQDFSFSHSTSGTASGGIGDTIFLDRDNDGNPDDGEGIEGVEVLIFDHEGRLITSTWTDENGKYFFDNLDPTATYQIEVNTNTLPPGLTNTVDPNGGNDSVSSYDLSTSPDGINIEQDFGYVPSGNAGSIGTLIWYDNDADGTAEGAAGPDGIPGNDDDEPGIAGVTVDLYIDNDGDGVLSPGDMLMGTTVTDGSGNYLFSNLPVDDGAGNPINYIVDVTDRDAVLNGHVHSLGSQLQSADNESKTDTYAVQLTNAEPDVLTADFGYYSEGASLGNFVWIDEDRDGLQDPEDYGVNGVPVTLTIDDGVNPPIVATVLTQTGPNGKDGWYSFDHLLEDEDLDGSEATYNISIGTHLTSPDHYGLFPTIVDAFGGTDLDDSDDHSGVVATPQVGFTDTDDQLNGNSEQTIASYDFGFLPTDLGDLPDTYDTSDSEMGPLHIIDNITFLGSTVDSELDGRPSTDATGDGADEDGVTFLTPLVPGTNATIEVEASTDGYLNAWIDFNSNGVFDSGEQIASDVELTPGTNSITFAVPTNATGNMAARFRFTPDDPNGTLGHDGVWDGGEVEDYILGSIGDVVWIDDGAGGGVGNDGLQNGGEIGLANVVVNLLYADGTPVLDGDGQPVTTVTDGSGAYEFPGLPAENYKVEFVEPNGYVFVDTNEGSDDAVDSDANQTTGITDQIYAISANTTIDDVDAGVVLADYGDLPDQYDTLDASGGPAHGLDGITFLGAGVDADLDGQPNTAATGDDTIDGNDDEDGVSFLTPLVAGESANIQVEPSVDGYLNAWIDFNSDGVLDEVTVTHVGGVAQPPATTIADLFLTGGAPVVLTVDVPADATGTMAARFRYSSDAMGADRSIGGSWDNGEVEDYVLGAIGNYVWRDDGAGGGTAADGIQDPGEAAVANVTVNLLSGAGAPVLDADGVAITTTTDSSGFYEFAGLPQGDYRVEFVAPTGSEFTTQDSGGDDAVDSDADTTAGATYGRSIATTIDAGEYDDSIDAGIIVYDYGDLPDVYGTTDASVLTPARHVIDAGTFLGSGVDDEADGVPVADALGDDSSGTDDGDGVVFTTPLMPDTSANIQVTAGSDGYLNAWIDFDSDGVLDEVTVTHLDGNLLPLGTTISDLQLTQGVHNLRIAVPSDADGTMAARFRFSSDQMGVSRSSVGDWGNGEVEDYVLGALGDIVFYDNGAGGGTGLDGVQNGTEPGVEGVVVNLLDASGDPIRDANGDPISTVTDVNGQYGFVGLPPGDYRVEFVAPTGTTFTQSNTGLDDAIDSDANSLTGITGVYTIDAAETDVTVDAGLIQYDRGDLPDGYGTTIAMNGAAHGIDGVTFLGAGVDAETDGQPNTNATGDDTLDANDDEDGVTFLSPLTAGDTAQIEVTASTDGFLNAWIDFNSNGTFDVGEQIATDEPLTAGSNIIEVAVPSDATGTMAARFRFTSDDTMGALDSTGAWDNGEVEDYVLGAIGNYVWEDNGAGGGTAGDGIQDPGEPGVQGVVVNLLDGDTGNPILDPVSGDPISTVTDANGFYEFAGLPDGNYQVEFVEPTGFDFTDADAGSDESVDSDANTTLGATFGHSVVTNIAAGETDDTLDAGIVEYDYGDLPDGYGTTDASGLGPARHVVDDTTFLGSGVDAEDDGQPSTDATGDGSDEDGIVFLNPLMPGESADIQVTAGSDGYLNAWIDFDSDGTLDDIIVTHLDGVALPPATTLNDLQLTAGVHAITIDVPADATGTMAARFRFTSDNTLGALTANNDWDNGEVEDYVLGAIGDVVFLDNGDGGGTGNDGIQNGTEAGVEGVIVNLLDENGDPVLDNQGDPVTTTTDVNGNYEFPGLPAGDYKVEFEAPTGLQFTETDIESGPDGDNGDSDANETTGITDQTYTVGPATDIEHVDAGLLEQDFGDLPDGYGTTTAMNGAVHGIDGATFLGAGVDAETDGQPNTNATGDDTLDANDDEDGVTFLSPLTAGDTAQIEVTASTDGYLNAWIDFNSNGTFDVGEQIATDEPLTAGSNIIEVAVPSDATGTMAARFRFTSDDTLGALDSTGAWDNGEVEDYVLGAIGSYVWEDNGASGGTAGDGVQDPGEPGVQGVVVNLLDGDTGNPILDPVSGDPISTVTDVNGFYEFAGLPDGNYQVEFVEPTGFDFTDADAGSDDSTDSDANTTPGATFGHSGVTNIEAGETDDTLDAGIVEYDYGDLPDGYGTTDGSGLGPARHVVDDTTFLGSGVDAEDDGQPSTDATGDGSDEDGIVFLNPLMPGESADIQVTAGSDGYLNAWIDFNSDGTLDDVIVTRLDGVALPPATTLNDLQLTAGVHAITINVPSDAEGTMAARFRFTSDDTLGALTPNNDWDNGEVEDYVLGTIGDVVFLDNGDGGGTGNDGIQNGTEAGVAGVIVNLLDENGDPVLDNQSNPVTTTTDANGNYEFPGLPAGDYKVEFLAPTGLQFTETDIESGPDEDNGDSDANETTGITDQTYTVGPATDIEHVDAGLLEQDFGDLPDGYGTTTAMNGAAHGIDGATFLGAGVDAETDGQPNTNATGDDTLDANDDEDGVTFLSPLTAGDTAQIEVTASTHGFLNAWIDFNSNGTFDVGEQIATDEPLTAGSNIIEVAVPTDATGTMAARFRFTSDDTLGALDSTGAWDNGEVEDYVLGAIGNYVWEDNGAEGGTAGDGIQDAGEPGVQGVVVNLLDGDTGNPILDPVSGDPISTITDANGFYEFAGLPDGNYQVEFVEPTGFDFTDADAGSDDSVDSDANITPGATFGHSGVTNIEAGETDDTLDAGIVEYDYGDLPDGYGTTDGAALGPARHVVDDTTFLGSFVDTEDDGQPNTSATGDGDNGDEDGIAFLNPLMPGESADIQVTAGSDGYLNAWIDFNSDGTLDDVIATHVDGVSLPVPTAVSDLLLDQGVHTLTFNVPSDATGTMAARFRFTSNEMGIARSPNGDWDNGEVEDYVLGAISDAVWLDNGDGGGSVADGIQNGSEPGVPDVVVNLLDVNGDPIVDSNGNPISTVTDPNGNYSFVGLPPGDYRVGFEAPDGHLFTSSDQGTEDSTDSDSSFNGITNQVYSIDAGEEIDTVDAGVLPEPVVVVTKQAGDPVANEQDWDVTFTIVYENLGPTSLNNLTLFDDIAAQLGDAAINASNLSVSNFSGTGTAPLANVAWELDSSQSMISGGQVDVGDSFEVSYTITINPDVSGTSSSLENQATGAGDMVDAAGNPILDQVGNQVTATDDTDDGSSATGDAPTSIEIADLGIAKAIVGEPIRQDGNFLVTYQVIVENTGTVDLANLSLTEDLAGQFGVAYVNASELTLAIAANDAQSSITVNPDFNGGTDTELLDVSQNNVLQIGDSFVLTFVAEVSPSDEPLHNQVTGSGDAIDENGNPILTSSADQLTASDFSDGGTDPNSSNPGVPGDSGTWSDTTIFNTPRNDGATGNPPRFPGLPPIGGGSIGNLLGSYVGSPGPIYSGIPINTSNPVTLESGRPVGGGYSGDGSAGGGMQQVECCEIIDATPGQPVAVETVPVEEDCGCDEVIEDIQATTPYEGEVEECGECVESVIEGSCDVPLVDGAECVADPMPCVKKPSFLSRMKTWLTN